MIDYKKQILLVIAPHPDDEVIGCAGLIKKIKDNGGKVYILFLTVGDTVEFSHKGSSTSTQRKREIEKVAKLLKYNDYHIAFEGNEYHLKLDLLGQEKLMNMIEKESIVSIKKTKPTMVVFPSYAAYNQDHRIAAYAAHACIRPTPAMFKYVPPIALSYEEPSDVWTLSEGFSPNVFIHLTSQEMRTKEKAMNMYSSQYRGLTDARSPQTLRNLALLRGAQSGAEFAEAYYSYRITLNQ